MPVERVDDDLPVAVRDAAVHQVAASDGDRERILFGRILPLRVVVVEVDRVDVIGVGGFEIHRVTDDERLAFVAARRSGRHRPGGGEVLNVIRRNLVKRAVSRIRVILTRHHPLRRVLGHVVERYALLGRAGSPSSRDAESERDGRSRSDQNFAHIIPHDRYVDDKMDARRSIRAKRTVPARNGKYTYRLT